MLKNITIFDLDGTVIDSSHRCKRINGEVDLPHWFANSVRSQIFKDTLLPLAEIWKELLKDAGNYIIICTSRSLGKHDLDFLANNGLKAHKILDRPQGNMKPDYILKARQLKQYLALKQFCGLPAVMYDDEPKVRHSINSLGIPCYRPILY